MMGLQPRSNLYSVAKKTTIKTLSTIKRMKSLILGKKIIL